MLLKSLTEALRKQKHSNAVLEAKLAQSAAQRSSRLGGERDENGQFVSTAILRKTHSSSRSTHPIATAQVEVPSSSMTKNKMMDNNIRREDLSYEKKTPQRNNLMESSSSSSSKIDGALIPEQIETGYDKRRESKSGDHYAMKGAMTAPPMNKEGGFNSDNGFIDHNKESAESRELMKRSFLMHKSVNNGADVMDNGGGGGDLLARSSPSILQNGRISPSNQNRSNRPYIVEGEGNRGGGPKGSRLGKLSSSNHKNTVTMRSNGGYDARLF